MGSVVELAGSPTMGSVVELAGSPTMGSVVELAGSSTDGLCGGASWFPHYGLCGGASWFPHYGLCGGASWFPHYGLCGGASWFLHYGLVSEGEFLDITEIRRQQGEDFECITNNGVAPPDARKVKVTVSYAPSITDAKNMPGQVGKMAVLRCEAMAVPTATFEWYRDEHRTVEGDGTVKIKNEKTRSLLLFNNVTEKHFGNYTCQASNRLGTSNASMLLFSTYTYRHTQAHTVK
ncbi:hypothetical protein CRUP_020983 [Coryphaenoides rupestris]|nr:hypothetical protein CRUP_020983 [Coryphaenoides rupestris]